jgi:anti-anti-sigma factor
MSFSAEGDGLGNATVRIAVFGRLDAATDHALHEAIHDVLAVHSVTGIVVDLGGVAFVDDAGMSAIESSLRTAGRAEIPLLVVNAGSDATRSVLDGVGTMAANGV